MKLNFNTLIAAAISTTTFIASAGENLWVYAKGTDNVQLTAMNLKLLTLFV